MLDEDEQQFEKEHMFDQVETFEPFLSVLSF